MRFKAFHNESNTQCSAVKVNAYDWHSYYFMLLSSSEHCEAQTQDPLIPKVKQNCFCHLNSKSS